MPPNVVTTEMFKTKSGERLERPPEFGAVTITFEELQPARQKIVRPTSVYGLVYPCTTSERPSAPEPKSGLRVSMAKKIPSKYRYDSKTGRNYNNQGTIDMEKGHIMALELGGPDIPENIVPQWAKWQGCGEWSQMESKVRKLAEQGQEDGYHVFFHCSVGYLKHGVYGASLKRLCTPNHFTVKVMKQDQTGRQFDQEIIYDASPERSDVDDQMFMRTLVSLEGVDYDDWVKQTDEKGRDKSRFVPSGQNPLYRGKKRPWQSESGSIPTGGIKRSRTDSIPSVVYSTAGHPLTPLERSAEKARLDSMHRLAAEDLSDDDDGSEYDPGASSSSSESSAEESDNE